MQATGFGNIESCYYLLAAAGSAAMYEYVCSCCCSERHRDRNSGLAKPAAFCAPVPIRERVPAFLFEPAVGCTTSKSAQPNRFSGWGLAGLVDLGKLHASLFSACRSLHLDSVHRLPLRSGL